MEPWNLRLPFGWIIWPASIFCRSDSVFLFSNLKTYFARNRFSRNEEGTSTGNEIVDALYGGYFEGGIEKFQH
jgi:hypothetical protein